METPRTDREPYDMGTLGYGEPQNRQVTWDTMIWEPPEQTGDPYDMETPRTDRSGGVL